MLPLALVEDPLPLFELRFFLVNSVLNPPCQVGVNFSINMWILACGRIDRLNISSLTEGNFGGRSIRHAEPTHSVYRVLRLILGRLRLKKSGNECEAKEESYELEELVLHHLLCIFRTFAPSILAVCLLLFFVVLVKVFMLLPPRTFFLTIVLSFSPLLCFLFPRPVFKSWTLLSLVRLLFKLSLLFLFFFPFLIVLTFYLFIAKNVVSIRDLLKNLFIMLGRSLAIRV